MDITVDISDLNAFADKMIGAEPIVLGELQTAMTTSTTVVQRESMQAVPVDRNVLRSSITTEVKPLVGVVGTRVPYAPVVEEGRRAGARMPPPGVLLGWMQRHGMDVRAEFALRRAIGRRGIKGTHFFQKSLDKMTPAINREFDAAVMRIIQKVTF